MYLVRRTAPVTAALFLMCQPPATSGQTTHTVELEGMRFTPADIAIDVGDTVRWVWISGFHNVESGVATGGTGVHDGNFRSGNPTGTVGTTFELLFDTAFIDANPMPGDKYPYYCIVHAGLNMVGAVTVLLRGDLDGDGVVDLGDHAILAPCFGGPGTTAAPVDCTDQEFESSDTDEDGDVDMRDFAVIQERFTG